MTKTGKYSIGLGTLALLAVISLWHATWAGSDDPRKPPRSNRVVTTETLGGPERFVTHLGTDKPIYRPGEELYVRGVVLHHSSRKPLPDKQQVDSLVEIVGPKGDTVASGFVRSEASVLGYSWKIPAEQAGGEYTIRVTCPGYGYTPAERKFDIRAYRPPRIKSQIEFLRDGYGPGDAVVATLEANRAEGGVPAGAKVTVIARVDGGEVFRGDSRIDESGFCTARFDLPLDIRRGEGTLAFVIEDGGVVETASKTIPILLQTVDLTMYPEGGDLVAGLPCQVYFEAFTPAGKPADLSGIVIDGNSQRVTTFRSEHEGRGRFGFTPKTGEKYHLKITQPAGITTLYPLPEVKDDGVVLSSYRFTTRAGNPIRFSVGSSTDGACTVTISQREKELTAKSLKLTAGKMRIVRIDPGDASGVLIATVWDAEGNPLAERLVFHEPADSVQMKITADADQYVPGGAAKLTVETTNSDGQPIAAVVGISVTDDSVLEMIDRREQAPRLPVMVFLENDVKELADAHVYLDPKDPRGPLATDLLLGTQGWRRFALVETDKLLEEHGDQARRALALRLITREELMEVIEAAAEDDAVMDMAFGGIPAPQAAAPAEKGAPVPSGGPAEAPTGAPDDGAVPEMAPFGAGAEEGGEAAGDDPFGEPAEGQPAPAADPFGPPAADEPVPADDFDLAGEEMAEEELPAVRELLQEQQSKERRRLSNALDKSKKEADLKRIVRDDRKAIRQDFVPVRVYAHQVRPNRQPGQRTDFTETLFWHAGVKTDPQTGQATIEFGLNDSVTSFRVFTDAFSGDGAIGTGTTLIESVEPFYLEPKLPLEVTMGDKVLLPLGLVNATDADMPDTQLTVDGHESLEFADVPPTLNLSADTRRRQIVTMTVGRHSGTAEVTVAAGSGPYSDRVTRKMAVAPKGFPVEAGFGGLIAANGFANHDIEIPAEMVAGSVSTRVVVYPTPLANMNEALQRLIREPCGCFEQTSSTTYPLVMAQQYFMSHEGVDLSLIERSAELVAKGYDRLLGFECRGGGFEWFGQDPGHEALTAYGVLEFTDMSQVHAVDPAMLDRTREWLLATRDGKGEFTRNRRALHTWVTEPECSNSYILWSLLEAGETSDLAKEVAWVRDAGEKTQNTYAVALAANVLGLAGDDEGLNHLLDKLAGSQTDDGSLTGATMSIVGSGGQALTIETTSLTVLAWLKNSRYAANVEKSIKYLAESCKAGRFGSTQSTVLALRAIVAYDQSRARPKAPGSLQLTVDGREVGQPVPFTEDTQGAIELPSVADLLSPGKHALQLKMEGGSPMPYSMTVNFHTLKPDSHSECNIHLETTLRDEQIDEGAVTEAEVVVINRTGEAVPTPVAIIGIPGGLEVRHDQLKELVKAGTIDAYEVLGRDVVLYWRSLTAEQRVELPLSLVAAVPGRYTGPASRAYLYYTDEHKTWNDGLKVEIEPKGQ